MANPPPNPDAPFARWLRERMAERGLTREELAGAVGVSPPAVSWWATGRTYPQWDARARLAAALGADPDDVPPRNRRG